MERMLGVMIDCSRNAVMNVEAVKKYANIIRKMGYNTLMLYTEDTYEVDNQPFFGHLRGRYSKEELKEIDRYCRDIDIELIPCIQTLAHLESMFKWPEKYGKINDCDDILLIDSADTYKLIEDMISTVAECFTSRKIHIGMDEAYRVGMGRYRELYGEKDRFSIINGHLHKVCSILKCYGFEPMIWSDMFYTLALNLDNQYSEEDKSAEMSAFVKGVKLPEEVSLVYWDYYSTNYDDYLRRIKTNQLFDRKVYFAGGAWTWKGFVPDNKFSMETTRVAMEACRKTGVDGVFFTLWGDDGSECSKFSVLPSLMYAAEMAKGNTDIESIKRKFKEITGYEFDSFMLFDELDMPMKKRYESLSKCILYNDLFLGIRNHLEEEKFVGYYEKLLSRLKNVNKKGQFDYLFEWYISFADLLSVKSNLSSRIIEAYKAKDMDKLTLAADDCKTLIRKLSFFHKSYQKRWFEENKPHGFDVQDIRLGGVIQRVKSCMERLQQYIDGAITVIEELEEPVLNDANGFSYWSRLVTPNLISHTY